MSRKSTLPMSIEVDICSLGTLSHSFCSLSLLTVPFLLPVPSFLVIIARLTALEYIPHLVCSF